MQGPRWIESGVGSEERVLERADGMDDDSPLLTPEAEKRRKSPEKRPAFK